MQAMSSKDKALAFDEALVVVDDVVEAALAVLDQVHLVDREHDMADAEQIGDAAVALGLGEHALPGVDQDDREIGGGGAGRHVAGILLMARRVGDDELASAGGEIAIGDVDGDALLALGLEAVDHEGQVQLAALGAVELALGFEGGDLVFQEQLGVVEQAADQRALAVVDAAAGEKAEEGFFRDIGALSLGETSLVHQKYPSCFFFSIEPG